MTPMRLQTRRRSPSAFTLTELIVVMAVIALLLIVAVPAFSAIIHSSRRALAESQFRVAVVSARAAALRSASVSDSAAAFFFEPGGRVTILACEKVGELDDFDADGSTVVRRDVFVPLAELDPVRLPPGWGVRALTGPITSSGLGSQWYGQDDGGNRYNNPGDSIARNWVFPETGFYRADLPDGGEARQTFILRFEGGSGKLRTGDTRESLVVSPSPSGLLRQEDPLFSNDEYRLDRATDLARAVRRILNAPPRPAGLDDGDKRALLGDTSPDTVLARSLTVLALYNEQEMAAGIRAELDRRTGTIYGFGRRRENRERDRPPAPIYTRGMESRIDGRLGRERLVLWIEGNTDLDDVWGGDGDEPLARLFTIHRYTGGIEPVPIIPARERDP